MCIVYVASYTVFFARLYAVRSFSVSKFNIMFIIVLLTSNMKLAYEKLFLKMFYLLFCYLRSFFVAFFLKRGFCITFWDLLEKNYVVTRMEVRMVWADFVLKCQNIPLKGRFCTNSVCNYLLATFMY